MTDTTLNKTIFLRATPAQVWAYLTDPEKLAIWFHKPKTALTPGGYEMFGTESGNKLMWGDVQVADPYTKLEYTFTSRRWATPSAPSPGRWPRCRAARACRWNMPGCPRAKRRST